MHRWKRRDVRTSALMALLVVAGTRTAAAAPTKEECIEAHSRGQDQQEAGHLALARDSFSVCSQPACPSLVQTDCAEFAEQLSRLSPSIGFAARDKLANDLPDTEVYVDGALVARRLDDGHSYDIDPGRHSVRFIHGEQSVLLNVVINQGERGRNLVATFAEPSAAPAPEAAVPVSPSPRSKEPRAESKRSALPLVVAVAGGAALATGGVLMGLGFGKIPGNCSLSTHECTSAPGDAAFGDAHSGVSLVNVGLTTAIAGAVVGITGLVWYLAEPTSRGVHPNARLRFTGTGFAF
ncbi:MAG TPA: hypothetical protein VHU80_00375 [Polyangiaceae bacterium]|jgi:hypothetical protein|nr:hypothetical protein [Polyangiaceae bacterium]